MQSFYLFIFLQWPTSILQRCIITCRQGLCAQITSLNQFLLMSTLTRCCKFAERCYEQIIIKTIISTFVLVIKCRLKMWLKYCQDWHMWNVFAGFEENDQVLFIVELSHSGNKPSWTVSFQMIVLANSLCDCVHFAGSCSLPVSEGSGLHDCF